jgi:hypothetical protein
MVKVSKNQNRHNRLSADCKIFIYQTKIANSSTFLKQLLFLQFKIDLWQEF